MTSATPPTRPSTAPPDWPHCGHGATAEDSVGCRGSRILDRTACLAHAPEPDRAAYLAALAPGADIDHRGTPFTAELLDWLLDALRDPTAGRPRLGTARFDWAVFSGGAGFERAIFSGDATGFEGAAFSGDAWFDGVTFSGDAGFDGVTFSGDSGFEGAAFPAAPGSKERPSPATPGSAG
ncbi:pentapeptide repeat-containing protein [Streptomyces albus]|uniref:pentapeptide repeat-containing protein n=1 Tax=Streptomyces albus TaxID=1888 RepID=UPI00056728F7|nr:pentapeptide repeat-containing protein [Streptomyces albus]